jgi:hypothetical protein
MIKRLNDLENHPYHRPNDNWVDVPVQTVSEDGELMTVTVRRRSLRARRRIFTLSCTGFTIGLLMILCTSPYSYEFLAPGELSSNHAQILAGEGANRCSACHAAGNGSVAGWIASTLALGRAEGLTQSELCMKCHDKTLVADAALNPHNVAPEKLTEITNKFEQVSFDGGVVFHPPVSGHNIACSACHREHHGSKIDLTAMTDKQCQTCHQSSFHSFETDHPELVSYPLKRRSRIAFDHASHSMTHFPSKHSEFNCNQCHIDDEFQNVKKLASYEQACSVCHHQQILESGRDGLALISLPMLDTHAIEAAKLKVGSWPLAATGDFDGAIPPIMRVLLSADPRAAEILGRLGPDFDFSDFDPAKTSDVEDAVELAWAIKRLLNDLSLDGQRAIRSRLELVMRLDVEDHELQQLITNLDELVFQNAVRRWLPNLNVEVANHRFGQPKIDQQTGRVLKNIALKQSKLSWWPADEPLLMRAGTDGELLAENPLAGLIKTNDGPKNVDIMPIVRVPAIKAPEKTEPQEPVDSPVPMAFNVRLKNIHADPLSDPELLAVNPLQLNGDSTEPATAKMPKINKPRPTQTGLVNADDVGNDVVEEVDSDTPTDKPEREPFRESRFVKIDRPPVVMPSGWFRNDNLFQIGYRPSGHADNCLQCWIELVTRATDADSRPETKQLFEKTISITSIGMCRTCHTTDQLPDRSFAVNWRADNRDPSVRSFTRFAHGPHLIQPNLQDCSHCHTLDTSSSNRESFQSVDASMVVSNFLPITKSNCTSCHSANQTNNGCTQCHNYHVGSKVTGSR